MNTRKGGGTVEKHFFFPDVNIRDLTTVETNITFVQSLLFTRCFAPASYVTSNLERCDL